mmetsp:Transcript_9316/g.26604  ORF Transcript_9316/g.26604 Transcript_9316/m.26604 type:complete len:503 (-) Transcript_9316:80-1588(-)
MAMACMMLRPSALTRLSWLMAKIRMGFPLPSAPSSSILICIGLDAAVVYRVAVSVCRWAFRARHVSLSFTKRASMGSWVLAGTRKTGSDTRSSDRSCGGSTIEHSPAMVNLASDRSSLASSFLCALSRMSYMSSTFSLRSSGTRLNSRTRSNTFCGWLEWMWSLAMSPPPLAGAPMHATESPYSAASSPVTAASTSALVAPSFSSTTASVQYWYLESHTVWSTSCWCVSTVLAATADWNSFGSLASGSRSWQASHMPSTKYTKPCAPESTTPAFSSTFTPSTISWSGVLASSSLALMCHACSRSCRLAGFAADEDDSASSWQQSRHTLSSVPSTGLGTASSICMPALARQSANSRMLKLSLPGELVLLLLLLLTTALTCSASDTKKWLRMVPELPCPFSSTSAARLDTTARMSVDGCSTRLRAGSLRQTFMLAPVSPSGIGNTLILLSSSIFDAILAKPETTIWVNTNPSISRRSEASLARSTRTGTESNLAGLLTVCRLRM